MPEKYTIETVREDTIRLQELMGSKRKFWYQGQMNSDRIWLFKYPNDNSGEHWAEKIAAEVAAMLDIEHARVELAASDGMYGSVTESFIHGNQVLIHGNQLLAITHAGYDSERTFQQSSHTLCNIWGTLNRISEFVGMDRDDARQRIAEYIVLDAVIGNTDRHHENWGVVVERVGDRQNGRIAPSFDHASSLGRELRDERRILLMNEHRVGQYSEKGRGAIYWSEDQRHCPSPLELARRAARQYPDIFQPALSRLDPAIGSAAFVNV